MSKLMPNGPFEIIINDYQRKLLVQLIKTALKNADFCGELAAQEGDVDLNALCEAEMLENMLAELPDCNEEWESGEHSNLRRRRTLHGLCL